MLLRSSSTPVLTSLLSSFSETTPNSITTPEHASNTSSILPHNYGKISYNKKHHHHGGGASPNLTVSSLYHNSSPISPSVSESLVGGGGFRRAQSDGNLEALASATSNYIDDFCFSLPNKKVNRRANHRSTLEAIPSFSYQGGSRNSYDYDDESDEEEEEVDEQTKGSNNGIVCDYGGSDNIRFAAARGFQKEGTTGMYLARGLGVSDFNFVDIGNHINGGSGGGGGGQGYRPVPFGGDGGNDGGGFITEEHYKKMVEENPGNALCLRNYAQFLHQTKKDLTSAEEYYCRTILADPTDGEVLCQYAKLVWELYRDIDRARDYFERAVRAAAEDSHVQAAYACFLWEAEAEEEDEHSSKQLPISTLVKEGITA